MGDDGAWASAYFLYIFFSIFIAKPLKKVLLLFSRKIVFSTAKVLLKYCKMTELLDKITNILYNKSKRYISTRYIGKNEVFSMSKWDDLKKKLGRLADKTANKTRELTDTAALKIKIANKEADRDLEYKKLGKMTYAKLKNFKISDPEELTAKISESLENLDRILYELKELKKEAAEKKAEKEAEKAAEKAAKQAEKGSQNAENKDDASRNAEEDVLDVKIMEDFNSARKEADEKYEEAKIQAIEAEKAAENAKS